MTIRKGSSIIAGSGPVDQVYNAISDHAQSGIAVASAVSSKANDNAVVHLTGTESIGGTKDFSGIIYLPREVLIKKSDNNLEGGQINFQKADNDPLSKNPALDLYNGEMRFLYCNGVRIPATDTNECAINTLSKLKSSNGYFKLGNGLIIQWGVDGQEGTGLHTVTLPTAFTSVDYKVVGNVRDGNWSSNTQYVNAQLLAPSTATTFTIYRVYNLAININWIAIGY